jgi:hypothetical protein
VHEERHQPAEHPCAPGRDGQVAGEPPSPQQQHRHHEQADRPQRGELVQDQEQGAGAARDRVEESDDRFLGRGRVVRVQDQRDEQQRREHGAGEVSGTAARGALGALAGRDFAQVGQQRAQGAHLPPCHARRTSHLDSSLGGADASRGIVSRH